MMDDRTKVFEFRHKIDEANRIPQIIQKHSHKPCRTPIGLSISESTEAIFTLFPDFF
jgi:hypothetical protein